MDYIATTMMNQIADYFDAKIDDDDDDDFDDMGC